MFEVFVLCLLTWEGRGISREGTYYIRQARKEVFGIAHVACYKSSFVFKYLRA